MMSSIKTLLAISGLVVVAAAGCAQPGIIEEHPAATPKKDAGTATKPKDAGKTVVEDPSTGDDDVASDDVDSDDVEPDDEAGQTKVDAGKPSTAEKDAGKGSEPKTDAGKKADAGKEADPAGETPGPCPTGYMCTDAQATLEMALAGATIKAPDGKPVGLACGKGGLEACDQKMNGKDCKNFTNGFCAELDLGAIGKMYTCAQRCSM